MNLKDIDHRLDELSYGLFNLTDKLEKRDKILKKVIVIKRTRKTLRKLKNNTNKPKKKYIRHSKMNNTILIPKCHPDRKYHAKDMCKSCYEKAWNKRQLPSKCHPDRLIFRGDKCKPCYRKWRLSLREKPILNPIGEIRYSFWRD